MEYTQHSGDFATLNGDDCPLGLAFVDPSEAIQFREYLARTMKKFMNRVNEMSAMNGSSGGAPNLPQSNLKPVDQSAAASAASHSSRLRNTFSGIKKKVRHF